MPPECVAVVSNKPTIQNSGLLVPNKSTGHKRQRFENFEISAIPDLNICDYDMQRHLVAKFDSTRNLASVFCTQAICVCSNLHYSICITLTKTMAQSTGLCPVTIPR